MRHFDFEGPAVHGRPPPPPPPPVEARDYLLLSDLVADLIELEFADLGDPAEGAAG